MHAGRGMQCWRKKTSCTAAAQGLAEYAPDRIRNLGTAGAMAGGEQRAVGGGVQRMTEMTGQNVGSLVPRYEWTRLLGAATGSIRELGIKRAAENERV